MSDPTEPQTVTLIDPDGNPKDAPAADVPRLLRRGFTLESNQQHVDRVVGQAKDEVYGTPIGKLGAAAAEFNRVATFGGSDVVGTAIDPDMARHYQNLREVNPISTAIGGGAAMLATAIPTGGESAVAQGISKLPGAAVGRLGASIVDAGEGAGVVSRIGHAAVGGAAEGALYGGGQGVSDLALSDKPITPELVGSVLSSRMLYGAEFGGAAGALGKAGELGMAKAKGAIDAGLEAHAARELAPPVADDLAHLDLPALKAAKETELGAIKAAHQTELESIESARVTERKSIADDLASLRRDVKDTNQWATTKDLAMPATEGRMSAGELGRVAGKADKQLANLLDNPIGLAKNPAKALDALQRQETGLVKLLDHDQELRTAYAADGLGGKRAAALEAAPAILEKNRALQARIAEVSKPLPELPKTSSRLEAIESAKDSLAAGHGGHGGLTSIPQHMLEGSVFGTVSDLVHHLPIPGASMASHLIGAAASKFVGEKVFGGLSKAVSEQVGRTGKAVSAFLDTSGKVTKAATPIATRVLAGVRYGQPDQAQPKGRELPDLFKARSAELRSQVATGPDGNSVTRPEVRQGIADRLSPIAAVNPLLADRLETLAAKRLEFLADRLPHRPDLGMQIGPDHWQPSDMEMRTWARYVAGVENPGGIEERLAHGHISPEDAEVMREVYPERLAEMSRQIIERLPALQASLPYHRKLALSILTGIPVDPAMDPRILGVLQGQFSDEPGTENGTQAPTPQPQFGSVKAEEPTPAQQRLG